MPNDRFADSRPVQVTKNEWLDMSPFARKEYYANWHDYNNLLGELLKSDPDKVVISKEKKNVQNHIFTIFDWLEEE